MYRNARINNEKPTTIFSRLKSWRLIESDFNGQPFQLSINLNPELYWLVQEWLQYLWVLEEYPYPLGAVGPP